MGILEKIKSRFAEEKEQPRTSTKKAPAQLRRENFVKQIDRQKQLIDDPSKKFTETKGKKKVDVTPKKQRTWVLDGKYVYEPRYGSKKLTIFPGKPHIVADTADDLKSTMDLLIEATKAGELDSVLAAAAPKSKAV